MFFQRAQDILKDAKSVRVFAPTGVWAASEKKQQWLEDLAKRTDIPRSFVAGLSPDKGKDSFVEERLVKLERGGVDIRTLPPHRDYQLGFIIFDTKLLMGVGDGFQEINVTPEVDTFIKWYDEVVYPTANARSNS